MHSFWTRPELGRIEALNAAIRQLHYAAQPIAAVGHSLLPHAPDDSHTNMEWLPDLELLAGDTIDDRIRIGLRFPPFSLCIADRNGVCVSDYELDGKTLAQAFGWLKQQLDLQGFPGERLQPIEHYELPAHGVRRGAAFQQPDRAVLRQICTCYHNAYGLLTGLAKKYTPAASGVRVWPHHFDMSLLIEMQHGAASEPTASLTVGLAQADAVCDEPYYFVSLWRESEPVSLDGAPQLLAGRWRSDGIQGAVLPLSTIPESASAEQQQQVVEAVLEEAIQFGQQRIG